MDLSEVLAPVNQATITFVIAGLIAFLIFLVVGYLISLQIVKPIRRLREEVSFIEEGNLDASDIQERGDEIGELARAFNGMVVSVKKSHAEIKQKVSEQTLEITSKAKDIEEQQKATLNILEDVEKEKAKTETLAQDLEKFKLAVDNASDHIVITDPNGIILYANKGVTRITGFSQKEVIGQKVGSKQNWGGQMPREFYLNMWDTVKVKKQIFVGSLQNKRKNGEKYEVLSSISPVLDDENKVIFFVGIERDITKEREIDKTKTEFVSLASHQLRTPLSSVNWYTEMLLDGDAGPINDDQKNYLTEIYTGNQRMVGLVNSLLNVSRLDLGTFAVEPSPVNVEETAESVVHELKPTVTKKHLTLKESYGKNMPQFLADQKLLRIIFQNLLSNAVKYTPESGVVMLDIRVVQKGSTFGGKAVTEESLAISVTDTGIGIPTAQADKIFTKLFRADNAAESEAEGTGLGLYIIRSIADQSGEKIWFESQEGKGSTFYVLFPITGMKKKEGQKQLD